MANNASSIVFRTIIPMIGMVAVVIEEDCDGEAASRHPLDRRLMAMYETENGKFEAIHDDADLATLLIRLAMLYLYVTTGVIVTSDHQATLTRHAQCQLHISNYGLLDIAPLGMIQVQEDEIRCMYFLAIAHPSPGMHLVVIQEVLDFGAESHRCIAINPHDARRIDTIMWHYLVQIGAITTEHELHY